MTISVSAVRRDTARREMAYCAGIMRTRLERGHFRYLNEGWMWQVLRQLAESGADFEVVKSISRSATSWSDWNDTACEYLKELGSQ